MKIVNVCGFNLSGCTAAFDLFFDYYNAGVVTKDHHETGFLKCKYSFGGAIQTVLLGLNSRPDRQSLMRSLCGEMPEPYEGDSSNPSVILHLQRRKAMAQQYGFVFEQFTADALKHIPDDIQLLSRQDALNCYQKAAQQWLENVVKYAPPANFHANTIRADSFLMFKNDPPGKFPFMASLLPDGITISVLRDPVDSCFDFNRYYNLGHSEETVRAFANIFGSWVRTVKNQFDEFLSQIKGCYFVVKFEQLILDQGVQQKLLELVDLVDKPKYMNVFQPEQSKKNIGIGQAMTPELIDLTQQLCMPEYNSLVTTLRQHNMLIESDSNH